MKKRRVLHQACAFSVAVMLVGVNAVPVVAADNAPAAYTNADETWKEKLGLLLQLIPKKELLKTMVLKLRLDIWKSLIIQLLYRLLFQKRDIHGLDGRLQNQMVMYIT